MFELPRQKQSEKSSTMRHLQKACRVFGLDRQLLSVWRVAKNRHIFTSHHPAGNRIMDISPIILNQAKQMIEGLLDDYNREIDEAYLNCDPDLTINITVKFAPNKDGIKVGAGISFVKEKIKNSISVVIDDKQLNLFDKNVTLEVKK